ncbi:MAG: hypothetical protein QNI86_09120 [Halieaceae bacterium]|nr:hypothetical protein [Halieaceae bacterium]
MKRRDCLKSLAALAGGAVLAGCEPEQAVNRNGAILQVPEFSTERLHTALDGLLAAYENRGIPVGDTLLPPLDEAQLRTACDWFPQELPPEIVALYGWRGGQEKDAWESEHPFWFRDVSFSTIVRARDDYQSILSSYGLFPGDRSLLKSAFPFAAFNGAWYVLPAGGHPFNASLQRPVVSVFEGIDLYYYSLEQMIATCTEWVSHPQYSPDGSLPHETELAIWRKHNPGIFVY